MTLEATCKPRQSFSTAFSQWEIIPEPRVCRPNVTMSFFNIIVLVCALRVVTFHDRKVLLGEYGETFLLLQHLRVTATLEQHTALNAFFSLFLSLLFVQSFIVIGHENIVQILFRNTF